MCRAGKVRVAFKRIEASSNLLLAGDGCELCRKIQSRPQTSLSAKADHLTQGNIRVLFDHCDDDSLLHDQQRTWLLCGFMYVAIFCAVDS